MKKKISSMLLLLLVAAVTGAGCASATPAVRGTVEAVTYSHYAEYSGKIISSPVETGRTVSAGDVLAVLDTRQEEFSLEQLTAVRDRRQAALNELLVGADREQLAQVENAVNLARENCKTASLALDRAQKDVSNGQILQANGALALQALDDLNYQAELAQSALTAANLQLEIALHQYNDLAGGASRNEIIMAAADLTQADSQVRQCEDRIARGTITALTDGTVISKNYLLGDVVAPGNNLIDIAADNGKYVTAYWPESELAGIAYGQEMAVAASDEGVYAGTLTFIDVNAVYTPKDEQTAFNRNKTSLRIKIRLPEETPLKIGEPVMVSPAR
jgi:HlyD family secretion protein